MKRFNLFQFLHHPPHLPPIYPGSTEDVSSLLLTRIFPHGRAYFFSDFCFQHCPQETLAALMKLDVKLRTAKPLNYYRILGRPDLLDWVYKLASADIERQAESLFVQPDPCLLYTSPGPRDGLLSRMPSSA